jgi:4-amino-4-deoxy-L-arabinose transferase-like glycosyltransferase
VTDRERQAFPLIQGGGLAAGAHDATWGQLIPATDADRDSREETRVRRLALARRAGVALVCCLTLTGVAYVHAIGALRAPGFFDDEGTYMAQAWAVGHLHALAPYTYWYDHPPLGWLTIAFWDWATIPFYHVSHAVDRGRQLMLVADIVGSALLFVLARRLGLKLAFAVLAVALYALSPLAVHFQRLVLLDNLAIVWLLAAFVLVLSPQRKLSAYAGAGVCFAGAMLTKETTLLLAPALIFAAWTNSDPRTRRFALTLFASLAILIAAIYMLYALLKSELVPGSGHVSLIGSVEWQLFTRKSSGWVFDRSSVAWATVHFWFVTDAWLLASGLALLPVALLVPRLRIAGIALATQVLLILRPGYLPAMYVLGLMPFAALIIAGSADVAWMSTLRRWPERSWRFAALRWSGPLAVLCCLAVALRVVGPAWATSDRRSMTIDANRGFREASVWAWSHLPHNSRVLVDDTFWTDLVEHGFDRERVVWFWKLGLDPAVNCRYPDSWRDFQYVVKTQNIGDVLPLAPATEAAVLHSKVIASFGPPAQRVDIRRILPGSAAVAATPRSGCPPIP